MKKLPLLASFAIFFMVVISFTSCGGSDAKTASAKKDKYEERKETLEEMEKKDPVRFLSVSSHDKKNLAGRRVITGTIKNNATVASYKDIEVELKFFSKTGTLLQKEIETVYETIAPGKEVDFKTKYSAATGTNSVEAKVIGAKNE